MADTQTAPVQTPTDYINAQSNPPTPPVVQSGDSSTVQTPPVTDPNILSMLGSWDLRDRHTRLMDDSPEYAIGFLHNQAATQLEVDQRFLSHAKDSFTNIDQIGEDMKAQAAALKIAQQKAAEFQQQLAMPPPERKVAQLNPAQQIAAAIGSLIGAKSRMAPEVLAASQANAQKGEDVRFANETARDQVKRQAAARGLSLTEDEINEGVTNLHNLHREHLTLEAEKAKSDLQHNEFLMEQHRLQQQADKADRTERDANVIRIGELMDRQWKEAADQIDRFGGKLPPEQMKVWNDRLAEWNTTLSKYGLPALQPLPDGQTEQQRAAIAKEETARTAITQRAADAKASLKERYYAADKTASTANRRIDAEVSNWASERSIGWARIANEKDANAIRREGLKIRQANAKAIETQNVKADVASKEYKRLEGRWIEAQSNKKIDPKLKAEIRTKFFTAKDAMDRANDTLSKMKEDAQKDVDTLNAGDAGAGASYTADFSKAQSIIKSNPKAEKDVDEYMTTAYGPNWRTAGG